MKTHQTNNSYNLTPLSVTPPIDTSNGSDSGGGNGTPVVVEPNLSSNSTTSAPSVKAVRDGINIVTIDVAGKAPLASPSFTGIPVAPTPLPGDNSHTLATTAYVTAAVNTANTDGVTKGYVDSANNSLQAQIVLKEGFISAGTASQYYRGDKTFQTLDKMLIGLSNVDNTSDANKPVSTFVQAALNLKADKASFTNVDNTSDINKPVSTLTQNALNLKVSSESLGSSAFKNIPLSGNAGNSEVVMGNDSRLSNDRRDADAVHKTGAETIAGIKTFTSNLFINNANITVTGLVESSGGFKYSDGTVQTTASSPTTIEQNLTTNSTTSVPSVNAVANAVTEINNNQVYKFLGNSQLGNIYQYAEYNSAEGTVLVNSAYNSFGGNVVNNNFISNYFSNRWGNDIKKSNFGTEYTYNTFGDNIQSCTFGNNLAYNTIGNDQYVVETGDNIVHCTLGNQLSRVFLEGDNYRVEVYNCEGDNMTGTPFVIPRYARDCVYRHNQLEKTYEYTKELIIDAGDYFDMLTFKPFESGAWYIKSTENINTYEVQYGNLTLTLPFITNATENIGFRIYPIDRSLPSKIIITNQNPNA